MAFLIAYSTVPNKRGFQIVGGVKSLENLISGGGVQISGVGREFGNPYLKMKYNFALYMHTLKLISLIFYENIPLAHKK